MHRRSHTVQCKPYKTPIQKISYHIPVLKSFQNHKIQVVSRHTYEKKMGPHKFPANVFPKVYLGLLWRLGCAGAAHQSLGAPQLRGEEWKTIYKWWESMGNSLENLWTSVWNRGNMGQSGKTALKKSWWKSWTSHVHDEFMENPPEMWGSELGK